ncbi:MAG TPA: helix-turn-helix domain-containing protein [Pyrinomonadaceae bacterium]|mgnify:CR=1 FL=1|nr:helix-turn-helix domain-containing protein [Pyrinomonadaceae bacterium]
MNDDFVYRLRRTFDFASMAAIARRIGVPHATVRNYFQGRVPAPDVLIKIANETDVSLNWLLSGTGEMYLRGKEPINLDRIIEDRITAVVDRIISERGISVAEDLGTIDEPSPFDVSLAVERESDPAKIMSEWFRYEGREYPHDFGVVFFQGWESFTIDERLEALRDAKKVLDRTLRQRPD